MKRKEESPGNMIRYALRAGVWAAVCVLSLFTACSRPSVKPDIAGSEALKDYDALINGRYDEYLAADISVSESIDSAYYDQLKKAARLFAEKQKKERGGVVRLLPAGTEPADMTYTADTLSPDAADSLVRVFLTATFGDGLSERILVTMARRGDRWFMR